MSKDEPQKAGEPTFLPRNFTITTQERLRALASGGPPFALRLRRIEDLEAALVRDLAALEKGQVKNVSALEMKVKRNFAELTKLIDDHNRYYPIEARLPIDLVTRNYTDWGKPWSPMAAVTMDELKARASRR